MRMVVLALLLIVPDATEAQRPEVARTFARHAAPRVQLISSSLAPAESPPADSLEIGSFLQDEPQRGRGKAVLVGGLLGAAVGALLRDDCTDCITVNPVKVAVGAAIGALVALLLTPAQPAPLQ